MNAFDTAVDRVLGHEGGYVNNPADPGGETKWGISKRQYPKVDIRNLPREGAIAIYRRDYWSQVPGDALPAVMVYQVFDALVNHSPNAVRRMLQRAAAVHDDGAIGPVSRRAIAAMPPVLLAIRFISERQTYYTSLSRSNWDAHGRGWMNRLAINLNFLAADLAAEGGAP